MTFSKFSHLIDRMPKREMEGGNEVLDRHMAELMRKEIAHLPEPYGSVCAVKIYAELTYREIAAEFQKSESCMMIFLKFMWSRRIIVSFHRIILCSQSCI